MEKAKEEKMLTRCGEVWEPEYCAQAPLATGTDDSFYFILACLGGKAMSLGYTRLQRR